MAGAVMNDDAARLTDLEVQATHQARVIEELSDELARQGKVIDGLEARIAALITKAHDVDARLGDIPAADERPPHW